MVIKLKILFNLIKIAWLLKQFKMYKMNKKIDKNNFTN